MIFGLVFMIFIFEPQIDYNRNFPEDFITLYALNETAYIFNFLFDLATNKKEQFDEIDKIIVVSDALTENTSVKKSLRKYENVFTNYSPFSAKYAAEKYYSDILDVMPDLEKNDGIISSKIVALIRNCDFTEACPYNKTIKDNLKDGPETYLYYLPFTKKYLDDLLRNFVDKEDMLILYSHSEKMRTREFNGIIRVDTKKYFQTLRMLEKARKIEVSALDASHSDLRNYKPAELFRNFPDEFCSSLREANLKKHISINGEDDYLMLRTINYIVRHTIPNYYDLRRGIPEIDCDSGAYVFLKADTLQDTADARKLFWQLREISSEEYIILQRLRELFYDLYFNSYMKLNLPVQDKVNNALTNIFLSLTNESSAFNDQYYRLERISRTNCLNELLSELTSIEAMSKVIANLKNITTKDLLFNTDLWYYIRTTSEKVLKKEKPLAGRILKLEHSARGWKFHGLVTKRILEFSNLKGLLLLAIIMEYKKHISYGEITQILCEYLDENISDSNNVKTNSKPRSEIKTDLISQQDRYRKNYFANFNYLRNSSKGKSINGKKENRKSSQSKMDRDILSKFIIEYVECVDNGYVLKENDKYSCVVIDPRLEKIIKDFKKKRLTS